jgi:hypothetical protein
MPGKRVRRLTLPPGAHILEDYTKATATVLGTTALCSLIQHFLGDLPMAPIYLLVAVLCGFFFRPGPMLFIAALSTLICDFLSYLLGFLSLSILA